MRRVTAASSILRLMSGQFYYGEDYHFHIDSTPEKQTVCSVTINRNAKFLGEEPSDAEYSAD